MHLQNALIYKVSPIFAIFLPFLFLLQLFIRFFSDMILNIRVSVCGFLDYFLLALVCLCIVKDFVIVLRKQSVN